VLANGLDTIYPPIHEPVARTMLNNGGLLTDFLLNATPERNNFVKRNRIIAGLSDATLVIESAIKGGALITADIAASYNRDVFAVPGRPGDQWSAGCNNLIKTSKAALVEDASDIAYFLGWTPVKAKTPVQKTLFSDLTDVEKRIYEMVSKVNELDVDSICRSLDFPVYRLSPILLQMELKGILKCHPGNLYRVN
jgi:DNA processing protein